MGTTANIQPKPGTPKIDEGRIVGGDQVSIEDYPYQISVLYLGLHICGGSIISECYAVTAGHCTDGIQAATLAARYGSSIQNFGGLINPVPQVFQHPNYNKNTIDYDISVLKCYLPFLYCPPIPLCSSEVPMTSSSALFLQAAEVPAVSDGQCKAVYSVAGKLLVIKSILINFLIFVLII